ncbi:MAG TPA: UDP-N-acetylmuramoyl-L-alanine--D-glutamate ligase [Vicinamibacterales bacterium]|nr:UDP-N-acetylmuramoyl-L-alanine--D-glutamate ligase [Vicinamibacterales bacterium]
MVGFSVAGQRVVVVGAARSGVAAARLLAKRGASVTLTDLKSRIDEAEALAAAGVNVELGGHDINTLTRADLVVLSPGVPARQPAIDAARERGIPVIAELELASRWLAGNVIAVTGTKGKSTTTTLIGRMLVEGGLRVAVGGNIGLALSAQVDDSTPDTLHVVEVSSFQLEGTDTFHPWVAVLLNFSPDHLDRHASVEEYSAAKGRIFARQDARDWAVVNADDPRVLELARHGRARQLRFGGAALREGIAVTADAIARREGGREEVLVPLSSVRLIGRHLLADVAAACGVATIAGVPASAMTRAVEGFGGLEHALEPVAEVRGVRFVNDSKATNVDSARRAIESFDAGLVVILGGRFKGGDLRELREPLATRATAVIAIGDARPLVRQALEGAVAVREAATLHDAVRAAYAAAGGRGTVLLAPACASFDMFRDYAERGRAFKEEVAALKREVERVDVRQR